MDLPVLLFFFSPFYKSQGSSFLAILFSSLEDKALPKLDCLYGKNLFLEEKFLYFISVCLVLHLKEES